MTNQRLEIRQSQQQSLVMTPQLQQSINLLKMSSHDLMEFIGEELEKNPLLMLDEGGSSGDLDQKKKEVENEIINELSREEYNNLWDGETNSNHESAEYADPIESNWHTSSYNGSDDESDFFENSVSQQKSLREHLQEQLNIDINNPVKRIIGAHLIDLLDDSGYMREDLSHLPALLGCSIELIEQTLLEMQKLDPAGVFARNLAECLELQLKEKGIYDNKYAKLLENLDLLAKQDLKSLKKICGIDDKQLIDMVGVIKSLNPKPAANFVTAYQEVVPPDVIVRKIGADFRVDLNPSVLPKLLVNNSYYSVIHNKASGKEDKKYISNTLSDANWIVKALEQRTQTILKVATEIVKRQQDFMRDGVTALRPMILKDISESLGIHESTVSRVSSNKYMLTPRGMFEMKYFFSSSIQSSDGGDDISSQSIKFRIKQLIDAEDAKKILSDDEIAEMLKKEGTDIARRTVAKYRESMNLGSSVQRRREKNSKL